VTATGIKEKVVAQRIAWIEEMVRAVAGLPLDSLERFVADPRNVAAADSYVRRALEALLDLGRHILAKGFGRAVEKTPRFRPGCRVISAVSRRHAANPHPCDRAPLLAAQKRRFFASRMLGEDPPCQLFRGRMHMG